MVGNSMNASVPRMNNEFRKTIFLTTNKTFASFHDTSVSFRCYDEKYYFRCLIDLQFCCFILNKGFACCKDGLKAQ